MTNFDQALKDEMKKVVRSFQHFTSEQRANHAASHRLGYLQRDRVGEHFYTHPEVPGLAFSTRKGAATKALLG